MKRWLSALLVLVFALPSLVYGAAAFKDFASNAGDATSTLTCNLPGTRAAGQLAIFGVSWYGGAPGNGSITGGTCISTLSATQVANSPQQSTTSAITSTAVYTATLGASPPATCTFTFTRGLTDGPECAVLTVQGSATLGVDCSAGATTGSFGIGSFNNATCTPSHSGDLQVDVMTYDYGPNGTLPSFTAGSDTVPTGSPFAGPGGNAVTAQLDGYQSLAATTMGTVSSNAQGSDYSTISLTVSDTGPTATATPTPTATVTPVPAAHIMHLGSGGIDGGLGIKTGPQL